MTAPRRIAIPRHLLLLAMSLVLLAGCYEHVVDSRGIGSSRNSTQYEANLKPNQTRFGDDVEDAIFGESGDVDQ